MQTVLITGGTGLIGKHLTKHLTGKGYKVITLTRNPAGKASENPDVTFAGWDIKKQTLDINAFQKCDYIVHLAGAGVVDKKWTEKYKQQIVLSRTESSALLVKYLNTAKHSVKAVVSASAIGWYGEDPAPGRNGFVEPDPSDPGFLGETCRLWEESIEPVKEQSVRLVKLRTGIVLSNQGGAFVEFKKPLKFGVAGILSKGTQIVSWIHIDDLCRMYIDAFENNELSGSYNAVAPEPVSNKTLTLALAKALKGKLYIPMHVPAFVLKIMLGKRSIEVLKSTTVNDEKIRRTGFTFLYPSIQAALTHLAKNGNV